MERVSLPPIQGNPKKKFDILTLASPRVTEAGLMTVARQIGMRSNELASDLHSNDKRLTFELGSRALTMYRASGGVRFVDRARWQIDDGKSQVEFGDDQAIAFAKKHAQRLRLVRLGEARPLRVTRLMVATADLKGEHRSERAVDAAVVFQRWVGGHPVDGPGGKLVVYLDYRGELVGFDRTWREIAGVRSGVKALRAMEEVAEEVATHYRPNPPSEVEVNQVRLGYFELGRKDVQRVLQPAYVIVTTLRRRGSKIHRRSVYVTPAATNAVGRFEPITKKLRSQEPRSAASVR